MNKEKLCYRPFSEIEIYSDGRVYICCPDFLEDNLFIGNIFSVHSFDEIWYSEYAIKIRKSILDLSYKYCKRKICHFQHKTDIQYIEKPPYPQYVRFSYDSTCNIKCIYCRDEISTFSDIKKFDSIMDTILLPLLSNTKILTITTAGEITVSKHSQEILKKAIEINPNLKFDFLSNGLKFNEDFITNHSLVGKINEVTITVSAHNKKTYEKIMRGSNYDKVMKNINYLITLKNQHIIKSLNLSYVVSSINYKEIPDFLDFVCKNNLYALIFEFRNKHCTSICNDYSKYSVWEMSHPQYNEFVKIIETVKNKFPKESYRMPELFFKLEKYSLKQKIIDWFQNLLVNERKVK
ncbi:MAG: SPASM domain-containing protein [Candidatus Gastranaerophilales bacterium]|nr:SPASM domain-containing protein [Candidatus Gastranaerophilales bacterium]